MTLDFLSRIWSEKDDEVNLIDELDYALSHCCDLSMLQIHNLNQLSLLLELADDENNSLERAKELRNKLVACTEQITERPVYPIGEIAAAIANSQMGIGSQHLERIKREIGVPFPRNKTDLARYYAIRLVMEGIDYQKIADFLDVDPRTAIGYIAQGRECVRLVLESQSTLAMAFVTQGMH